MRPLFCCGTPHDGLGFTAPHDRQPKLAGLQFLRAIAAIMVLVGHVLAEAEHYFSIDLPGDAIPWTRGVDIFFVISGFIIAQSAQRFAHQPLSFLWRRFMRVVPLYYLFTTLMVISLVAMPGATKEATLDPGQIVSSYLFLPYERADGRIAPVLSLGWTLNYEIFFYALTALCLCFRRPYWALASTLAILSLASVMPGKSVALTFYSNPLILEFLFGIALSQQHLVRRRRPSLKLATATVALGFLLLVLLDSSNLPRFLSAGIPATLIVAAGTLFCPQMRLPLQTLGNASFSLYLSHRFTMRALTLALLPLLPTGAVWIYVVLVCGFSICFATLVFQKIETPLLRHLSAKPRVIA